MRLEPFVRRFGRRVLLLIVLAGGVAFCTGPPGRSDDGAIHEVVQFTLDSLPYLSEGRALGDWRREYGSDAIEPYQAHLAEPANDTWCARATGEPVAATGWTATRVAYFYPPSDEPLPAATGADGGTADACRLGFLWTEIETGGGADAEMLADEFRRVIVLTLTDGDQQIALDWRGAARWRDTTHWRLGGMFVTSGLTDGTRMTSGDDPRPPRVFIAAAGRASGIRFASPATAARP
jgi:hypothetical protein